MNLRMTVLLLTVSVGPSVLFRLNSTPFNMAFHSQTLVCTHHCLEHPPYLFLPGETLFLFQEATQMQPTFLIVFLPLIQAEFIHLPLFSSHLVHSTGFPGGASGKGPACKCRRQETWVQSLGLEHSLEEGIATHSSILAQRVPWTEEPGGLQSTGSQRVRHE